MFVYNGLAKNKTKMDLATHFGVNNTKSLHSIQNDMIHDDHYFVNLQLCYIFLLNIFLH